MSLMGEEDSECYYKRHGHGEKSPTNPGCVIFGIESTFRNIVDRDGSCNRDDCNR